MLGIPPFSILITMYILTTTMRILHINAGEELIKNTKTQLTQRTLAPTRIHELLEILYKKKRIADAIQGYYAIFLKYIYIYM